MAAKKTTTQKPVSTVSPVKSATNTLKSPFSSFSGSIGSVLKKPASSVIKQLESRQPEPDYYSYTAPAIDTSSCDRMIAAYESKMKAEAETAKQAKAAEYDAQAKSAYIARLQNERTLADNLAKSGIRGGTTETAKAGMLSACENNKNQISADKSAALTGIDSDTNKMISEYTQAQEAAKPACVQAGEAEARQVEETIRQQKRQAAQNQTSWDREDARQRELNAYNEKIAAQERAYTAQKAAGLKAGSENYLSSVLSTLNTLKTVAAVDKSLFKISPRIS